MLVAELVAIDDGTAVARRAPPDKQPDWTYGDSDSGQAPADRYGEHRAPTPLPE